MTKDIFNRQELKFVITKEQATEIQSRISQVMRLDDNHSDGKPYTIYNLYIDTDDHALIRHSLTKPRYKEKLRVRSYRSFADDQKVFLEVKKRYKGITNKRRSSMTYGQAIRFIETGTVPNDIQGGNAQVISELSAMLSTNHYHPKTFITYDRLAYVARDSRNDLRITFDMKLRSQRFDTDIANTLLDEDRVILEIKSSYNMPLWLASLLSNLQIRKQSFSKYGREYLQHINTQRGAGHA